MRNTEKGIGLEEAGVLNPVDFGHNPRSCGTLPASFAGQRPGHPAKILRLEGKAYSANFKPPGQLTNYREYGRQAVDVVV